MAVNLRPKLMTFDKVQRVIRNQEIWKDQDSIVHRLPRHYQRRYWESVLRNPTPVHYEEPETSKSYDAVRKKYNVNEVYPIIPLYPIEAEQGLWGGEGILKGYIEGRAKLKKKILPRRWMPTFWWPDLSFTINYSEILDRYMVIQTTPRTHRLIAAAGGFDLYILKTSEVDLHSKLGCKLKRLMLLALVNETDALKDEKNKHFLHEKYQEFIIPAEEAEWIGLGLNEASCKQQDLEDSKTSVPTPLKFELAREFKELIDSGQYVLKSKEVEKKSYWSNVGKKGRQLMWGTKSNKST